MAVYFLDCPAVNRIKIGTAEDPDRRVEAVRLMCPAETHLLGSIRGGFREEQELHNRFAPLRRYGEWFEGTPGLREEIQILELSDAWAAAAPEAREKFLEQIDRPVMDRRYGS